MGFTIVHFPEAATGDVLLEKVLLEILQNLQESTSDLSRVFSWRFLVYFIPTKKWDEKREVPWWSSNIDFFAPVLICFTSEKWKYPDGAQTFTFLLEYRFVWRQRFQKKLDRWQICISVSLNRTLCCSFHVRGIWLGKNFWCGEHLTSSSTKTS